jgi:hypothetical protein
VVVQVVEHANIEPGDYFTLSCSGITHFVGADSDFTPLEQWEREYALFHRMRRIPFFAKYRKWKTFTVWKKNVKSGKVRASSATLRATLFLFVPALRDALLRIKALCCVVATLRLLEVKDPTNNTRLARHREFVAVGLFSFLRRRRCDHRACVCLPTELEGRDRAATVRRRRLRLKTVVVSHRRRETRELVAATGRGWTHRADRPAAATALVSSRWRVFGATRRFPLSTVRRFELHGSRRCSRLDSFRLFETGG